MKTAAVLTYPGHFLMTVLCLQSMRKHFPEIGKIYLLYDDMAPAWPGYFEDCQHYYQQGLPEIVFVPYSSLPGISRCWVGWWRAQLVKLHVDLMLPGDEWLVVDGDVIFDERCDLTNITPYSPWFNPDDNILDSMVSRYVDHMLGKSSARISVPEFPLVITSIIPFRYLDREQLTSLRDHANLVTGQSSFIDYHCDLFLAKEIVGYVPEGDKMVMHEWELIEAWNHLHRPGRYQLEMTGSGYQVQMDTTGFQHPRFRHSSSQDKELGREWFEHQDIRVSDDLWHKITHA